MEDSIEVSIRNSVICVQRKCAKGGGGGFSSTWFSFHFIFELVSSIYVYVQKIVFFTKNTGKSPCS